MNVYRRYFRVERGPLVDAVKEAREINNKAHDEHVSILKEIGAKTKYYQRDGRLVAVIFDNEPNRNLYKKVGNCPDGHFPKKNSKQGKALAKRLTEIKTKPEIDCLSVVGLIGRFKFVSASKAYGDTIVTIPSDPIVVYVSVPWHDVDPEKIEAYVAEKQQSKGRYDRDLEAVMWTPPKEFIEIKSWEVDKAIDEWNESCQAEC